MEAELKLAAFAHHQSDTWNQTKYQDEQKSMARQSEMLDEKIRDLQDRIDALRILVDQLVQEVSKQHDLEKDLDSEKTMIKELEDEIDANADLARAKLLSVERQLNDLKKSIAMVSQREKTYDNLLQKVGDLETEVARLRRENNEALHHNKALEEMIHEAKKRTEDLASRTVVRSC
jgi:chromosome segregation ATPase